MKTSKIFYSVLFACATLCGSGSANAVSFYDDNMMASNINLLTDTFMSYANRGDSLYDYFRTFTIYGTMERIDEYGDDGSLQKNKNIQSNDLFIRDVWVNANHINGHMHYNNSVSKHLRFNLATLGIKTRYIKSDFGDFGFGGFVSYINAKVPEIKSGGDVAGLFMDYKYLDFGSRLVANFGSLNNSADNQDFTNSWVNVADEIYTKFKLDKTLYFRPSLYVGYTWVSSNDLHMNNDFVLNSDYNFLNIAPSAQFIKEILPHWYASLSAKYVAHFGGDNDIIVNGIKIDGTNTKNHTDIGIELEHIINRFVIGGNIHKTLGGFDGLSTNLNLKYIF